MSLNSSMNSLQGGRAICWLAASRLVQNGFQIYRDRQKLKAAGSALHYKAQTTSSSTMPPETF
eukprot:797536-Pelagomonas_calceolata.AAC.2